MGIMVQLKNGQLGHEGAFMFETIMLSYLVLINLAAFVMFGADKWKAIRDQWRIPEKVLLLAALCGGSIGAFAGMQVFRHKTKHWKFKILVPLFFLMQVTGIGYIIIN